MTMMRSHWLIVERRQFSWGSYLTWVLDRRDFIYIHGHIDEPKLMVVDFIGTANNKVNFQYAVDKYDIKMVLMQKNVPDVLVEIMKSWKLVYQDDLSALWIR